MRTLRYLAMSVLVACTLAATGAPADTPQREFTRSKPRFPKLVRVLKLIVQPLGDGIVPPHP